MYLKIGSVEMCAFVHDSPINSEPRSDRRQTVPIFLRRPLPCLPVRLGAAPRQNVGNRRHVRNRPPFRRGSSLQSLWLRLLPMCVTRPLRQTSSSWLSLGDRQRHASTNCVHCGNGLACPFFQLLNHSGCGPLDKGKTPQVLQQRPCDTTVSCSHAIGPKRKMPGCGGRAPGCWAVLDPRAGEIGRAVDSPIRLAARILGEGPGFWSRPARFRGRSGSSSMLFAGLGRPWYNPPFRVGGHRMHMTDVPVEP